jgi:glycosyltransferase involved in cell wall biosynthesis
MPAYNGEAFIGQSIESVQQQTFQDWELLIVDDGSTDQTAAVIKSYAENDARIRYIWRQNGRQGKARNTALAEVPADRAYVAFLDADDLWTPEKLDTQLGQIRGSGADVVFCSSIVFSSENAEISRNAAEAKRYEGESGVVDFIRANRVGILTALVKRPAIEAVGNFPEALPVQNTEDYCLWLKLLREGFVLRGYPEAMARYRVHPGASTADMLNIIRPEIAMFSSTVFRTPAAMAERHRRIILLYRELVDILASRKDRTGIREHLRGLNGYLGHGRVGSALGNLLFLPLGLFRKFSWRILQSIANAPVPATKPI